MQKGDDVPPAESGVAKALRAEKRAGEESQAAAENLLAKRARHKEAIAEKAEAMKAAAAALTTS